MQYLDVIDTVIHFTQNNEIEVTTTYSNGTKNIKNISTDDLFKAILSSVEKDNKCDCTPTPTLPNNEALGIITLKHVTFSDGREIVFILKKAHRCDIQFYEDVFKDVGIPSLIFAITLSKGQFRKASVLAVKDKNITDDTQLYHYPFSNVGYNGGICFGRNHMITFDYKRLTNLQGFPDMFLSMPNNNDQYGGKNNSGLEYRPLLKELSGKDFPDEYLKLSDYNFINWSNMIGGIKKC